MGIIYNSNVEEKELYSAYGMTVYGKENDYDWSIYPDRPREKCYISLRISNKNDGKENNIINLKLENRCIFKENFDRTIDNFLYWINRYSPSNDTIENAVFKSLTTTDSVFNYIVEQRKRKEYEEEKQRKRAEENARKEQESIAEITEYCTKHGLFLYEKYEELVILKPLHGDASNMIKNAIEQHNKDRMEMYVDFAVKHPDNKDLQIVASGTIEEVLDFVRK